MLVSIRLLLNFVLAQLSVKHFSSRFDSRSNNESLLVNILGCHSSSETDQCFVEYK